MRTTHEAVPSNEISFRAAFLKPAIEEEFLAEAKLHEYDPNGYYF